MDSVFGRSKKFSNERIAALRLALEECGRDNIMVVVYGSYARREASENSDLDYILIGNEPSAADDKVKARILEIVKIEPSPTGSFGKWCSADDVLKNIGGKDDTNDNITRRILLLLEGEWLSSRGDFELLRRRMITKYVESTSANHQIALFLLNDIIRYWRTVTVDYRFKVEEGGKAWAVRNLKLVFSRKLMYAGGVFSVALTADKSKDEKIKILDDLFRMPVIDRLECICGTQRVARVRESYELFLGALEDKTIRERLKILRPDQKDDPIFRKYKNESHNFTRELMLLLECTFHSTHPIHRALVF